MSTTKVYQQCWEERAGCCAQEGAPNNTILLPNKLVYFIYLFWIHLFRVGLLWHTIGIYHSAI